MLSVFVGRVLRDMVTAMLTIEYGPQIVNMVTVLTTRHRIALAIVLIALLALLVYWAWRTIWKKRPVAAI